MCECCCPTNQSNNKVSPGTDAYVTHYGRVNGWSCPWHPLQFVGWFFILLFAITHFAILVHYLPLEWIPAGVIIPASGYFIHLVYHFLALTLDPADLAVRKKGIFPKHSFDQTKHKHVIENSYCYICETEVSSHSKHCSICNKCVSDFDHHCKWLNNCVGGRNYKLFLGSCISGFATAFVMFIIDLYLVVAYYVDRPYVLPRSAMDDWKLFVPVCKEAYIIFTIVNGVLLLIAMALLGHLLIFHGYLICKKMSTYEYIIRERQRSSIKDFTSDVESAGDPSVPPKPLHPLNSTHTHHETHYTQDAYVKGIYEEPSDNVRIYTELNSGRQSRSSHERVSYVGTPETNSVRVTDNQVTSSSGYELSESPLPGQCEESMDEAVAESKKKRRLKHRTSSKVGLIQSEVNEQQNDLSPTLSKRSVESDHNRYNRNIDEMVLDDFRSPKVSRVSRTSRPSHLTEESAYANIQEQRNESVVSRPRSPSPESTHRLSNVQETDYLFLTRGKASQSSLSTLNLQDHAEDGKPTSPRVSLSLRPILTPTKEESVHSKSSNTSLLSPLQENSSTKGDVQEDSFLIEDGRIISPNPSLSKQPVYGTQEQGAILSPVPSYSSQLSLSNAAGMRGMSPTNTRNSTQGAYVTEDGRVISPKTQRREAPRQSTTSKLTNVTYDSNYDSDTHRLSQAHPASEQLISSPLGSETKLTQGVPNEKPVQKRSTDDLKVTNVFSEDESLIFEDEFINVSDQNNEFWQASVQAANANILAEDRRRKLSKSPNAFTNDPPTDSQVGLSEPGFLSDADSQKLAGYVEAFKKKRNSSQYSFGSDSGGSGSDIPLAVLNEETDTYALTDSLNRVKKLSDAFPSAIDQEKLKKRSLPHPRFKSTESMAELSVVEYNRKKKLKKKRPGTGSKQKNLPPLRGRKPLAEVTEESDQI